MPTPVAVAAAFVFMDGSVDHPMTNARVAVLANGTLVAAGLLEDLPGLGTVPVMMRDIFGNVAGEFHADPGALTEPTIGIAALANGNVVTAFYDSAFNQGWVSINDSTGAEIETVQPIGTFGQVGITGLANGNFAVVTVDGANLRFTIYGPTGTLITTDVIDSGFGDSNPEITALADGGFVIGAVASSGNGDPTYFIYDADGTPRFSGFSSGGAVTETDTFVFGLANGNFVSVFTNASGSDGGSGGIYGLIHGPSGPAVSGLLDGNGPGDVNNRVSVNTTVTGNQHKATGVGLSDGGFVVAWSDDSVGGGNGDIRAQAFNADGSARGIEFVVASGTSTQDNVSVALMADGRLIFTWQDDAAGHNDIMARIFDPRESAITRFGTTLEDQWVGTVWGDTLFGQDGDDVIDGGGGDDLIEGGNGGDYLLGNNGNDIIRGGAGRDYLVGGAGFDQLNGGDGGDYYFDYDGLDTITETNDGSVDGVATTVSVDLAVLGGGLLENASGSGGAALTLSGNARDNRLSGMESGGADILVGRAGNDTYFIGAGDTVTEVSGAAGGIDTIVAAFSIDLATVVHGNGNVENATAGDNGASLFGNALANVLDGSFDTLANALQGRNGNDTYVVDAIDTVTEAAGVLAGNDTVQSEIVNINLGSAQHGGGNAENARATGTSTISLTGTGVANMLDGAASTGINALVGLGGNDTYVVGLNDTITETATGGAADMIRWTGLINQTYTIKTNVENLTLTGTAATRGTGTAFNNTIIGNSGANILTGNAGNDTLSGMNGADILHGGIGRDVLIGGLNNDTFRYLAVTESRGATMDVITDFDAPGKGNDTINLAAIFGPRLGYIHAAAFTAAGQVRINDIAGADVIVEVNTGGSLAADFAIRLSNTTLASMNAGDFVL